jgi:hypothetical protein
MQFYNYDVGSLVQLERGGPMHTVIWRGFIRARVPAANNLWGRAPVYRLDDGHWDCYYEEQITSVGKWYLKN